MQILITSAASPLGRAVTEQLAADHHLRLFDSVPVEVAEPRQEAARGELTDVDAVWRAVRGMDAVVHLAEAPHDLPADEHEADQRLLDERTRGTHILCKAAVEAGVKRIVYASSLDLFRPYPQDVYISEMWKPKPEPVMEPLSRYLGERTCREFAREFHVAITALRFGTLVRSDEVAGEPPDRLWLDERDAARAIAHVLPLGQADSPAWPRRWTVHHVCARHPNPRYLVDAFARTGFEPEHNFETRWADA